jgi:site-specific recombinase XerD
VEDVQAALAAMRTKEDGSPVRPATVNTYVAAVKSFLGFAHRVGFTRFNAAPLIKLKKAPRQVAQRIMGELDVRTLIRAAKPVLIEDASRFARELIHPGSSASCR